MKVHNPLSQDRLCPNLGRNLEPFEVADVPNKFETCPDCQCVLSKDSTGEKVSK